MAVVNPVCPGLDTAIEAAQYGLLNLFLQRKSILPPNRFAIEWYGASQNVSLRQFTIVAMLSTSLNSAYPKIAIGGTGMRRQNQPHN